MKNITTTDVRISSAALYVALPTLLIVGLTGYLFGNNNQATASIEGNAYILQENETLKLQNVKLQEDFDNLFALKELSDANHLSNLNQFDESTIEVEEHVEPSYSLSAQNARPEAIFEFSDIPPAANERVITINTTPEEREAYTFIEERLADPYYLENLSMAELVQNEHYKKLPGELQNAAMSLAIQRVNNGEVNMEGFFRMPEPDQ